MMNDKIYQMIFDELSVFLPPEWTKLVVYLEHGEEAYSYSFYVKVGRNYVKCFDLDISENKLFAAFARIEKKVSKERSKLDKCWSNMTMVVDGEGNMKTAFDYTDLSRGNYQYKKAWKKKYLD